MSVLYRKFIFNLKITEISPHSPDHNFIENIYSRLKNTFRNHDISNMEQLKIALRV